MNKFIFVFIVVLLALIPFTLSSGINIFESIQNITGGSGGDVNSIFGGKNVDVNAHTGSVLINVDLNAYLNQSRFDSNFQNSFDKNFNFALASRVPWQDVNVADNITVNWNGLQNYPTGCGANMAVQIIDDNLTCISVSGSGTTDLNGYVDQSKFDSNFVVDFDKNFMNRFDGNFQKSFDGNFQKSFDSNFKPKFDSNFQKAFDSNFNNHFDQNFKPYFDSNFQSAFDKNFNSALALRVPWNDSNIDDNLTINWNGLTNYPAGCPAGQAVQVIDDNLTCISVTSGGVNSIIAGKNVDVNSNIGSVLINVDLNAYLNQNRYDTNFQNSFDTNFKGKFDSNFQKAFDSNFKPYFDSNFQKSFDGNFKPKFDGNFQTAFDSNMNGFLRADHNWSGKNDYNSADSFKSSDGNFVDDVNIGNLLTFPIVSGGGIFYNKGGVGNPGGFDINYYPSTASSVSFVNLSLGATNLVIGTEEGTTAGSEITYHTSTLDGIIAYTGSVFTVNDDWTPSASITYNLGSATNRWLTGFISTMNCGAACSINTQTSTDQNITATNTGSGKANLVINDGNFYSTSPGNAYIDGIISNVNGITTTTDLNGTRICLSGVCNNSISAPISDTTLDTNSQADNSYVSKSHSWSNTNDFNSILKAKDVNIYDDLNITSNLKVGTATDDNLVNGDINISGKAYLNDVNLTSAGAGVVISSNGNIVWILDLNNSHKFNWSVRTNSATGQMAMSSRGFASGISMYDFGNNLFPADVNISQGLYVKTDVNIDRDLNVIRNVRIKGDLNALDDANIGATLYVKGKLTMDSNSQCKDENCVMINSLQYIGIAGATESGTSFSSTLSTALGRTFTCLHAFDDITAADSGCGSTTGLRNIWAKVT